MSDTTALKREDKAWGHTETLLELPDVAVFRLHFRAGGYTSIHWHARKVQNIVLLSGELLVREFGSTELTEVNGDVGSTDFGELSRTELTEVKQTSEHLMLPGDAIYCPHNLVHQLAALHDAVCIETYCPSHGHTVDPADIIRMKVEG